MSTSPRANGGGVDSSVATAADAVLGPEAGAPEVAREWKAGTLTYDRKGLVWLFSWLFWGDIGLALKERSLGSVVMALLKQYGISNANVALLMQTIPSMLNMFLGPIISYKSDRHRGRFGRRRPFLFWAVPITALSIMAMAFVPKMGQWLHSVTGARFGLNTSILICFGVVWIIFDVASVTAGVCNGGFNNDVVPHEVMGRFFACTRLISLSIGALFMYQFLGKVTDHAVGVLVTVGLLYGVGWLSAVIAVKEGEYPPPDPVGAKRPSRIEATISYFRTCFSKPIYLWLFLGVVINGCIAHGAIDQWSMYYATSVGFTLDGYGKLDSICYLMASPMAPLIGWAADKFHPLRIAMLAVALHMPLALLGGFLIHDRLTFGVFYIAISSMQFSWGTATPSLFPKLVPKASFTQFTTAAGLVYFIINMIYGYTLGKVLDQSHNNYGIAFIVAGVADAGALVCLYMVYRKYMALGGAKGYVAP